MNVDIDENLIDNLIAHSRGSDLELRHEINQLIELYTSQQRENHKLRKENTFFKKKFDQRQNQNVDNVNKDKIIEQQKLWK